MEQKIYTYDEVMEHVRIRIREKVAALPKANMTEREYFQTLNIKEKKRFIRSRNNMNNRSYMRRIKEYFGFGPEWPWEDK